MGSVRKRQTKSRTKYRTGPISTASSESGAEWPVRISCWIAGRAD
jgi:hypothetical protein